MSRSRYMLMGEDLLGGGYRPGQRREGFISQALFGPVTEAWRNHQQACSFRLPMPT